MRGARTWNNVSGLDQYTTMDRNSARAQSSSVHTSRVSSPIEMQGKASLVQILSDGHHIGDDAGCTGTIPGMQDIYPGTACARMHREIHLPIAMGTAPQIGGTDLAALMPAQIVGDFVVDGGIPGPEVKGELQCRYAQCHLGHTCNTAVRSAPG